MKPDELARRRNAIAVLVRHGHLECARLELEDLMREPFEVGPALAQVFDREGI